MMDEQSEARAAAGYEPLQHLEITVGVPEAAMGRRPIRLWMPTAKAQQSWGRPGRDHWAILPRDPTVDTVRTASSLHFRLILGSSIRQRSPLRPNKSC
jgi:hypothetical protein